MVGYCKQKKKGGMCRKSETACCGWQGGPGSCRSMSMSKLMGFVHPEIVEILNFDSFGPLKSRGGGCIVVSHTH